MRFEYLSQNREGYHYRHFFRLRVDDGGFRSRYDPVPPEVVAWLEEHVGKFKFEGTWCDIDGDVCISRDADAVAFRLRWC
ncbi:MAG: hypothetical protein EOP83_16010 [Verrucomicrobiaceae bacterium]|nr:MAG: hypothetical protein EOP83_16010 [Verrucomicrobiaceae bacterium]